MSSPSRQVGNRRLPPLPSGSRHSPSNVRASSGGHGSSPVSGKAVKGHASNRSSNNHGGHISQIDLTANFGDGPFRPALVQGKAITNGGHGKVYVSICTCKTYHACPVSARCLVLSDVILLFY